MVKQSELKLHAKHVFSENSGCALAVLSIGLSQKGRSARLALPRLMAASVWQHGCFLQDLHVYA